VLAYIIIGIYALSLLVIFFYALLQASLAINYLKEKRKKSRTENLNEPILNHPFITIQLPIYNEKYVVERLLDQTLKMNWPKDKIEFQILDDSADETTKILNSKIQNYKAQGFNINLVQRPNREGFKAGALKHGMTFAKGEFIAIFDADFLPDPEFLNRTIPIFNDEKIGVVQTRWEHINREFSLLTKLQAFALDAHFSVEQVGRNCAGHFINFNGTGGVWRRTTIEDAGGWQADTLTEDLDLSYRAQLKNWKFIYREDISSPAELPVAMSALKSQQFRWTKGGAETFKKIAGKLLFSKGIRFTDRLHGLTHLFNSSVFVFVLLLALSSVPLVYFVGKSEVLSIWVDYSAVFFISTIFLMFYYGVSFREKFSNRFFGVLGFFKRFFQYLTIAMGLSYCNTQAVLLGYFGKKTAFIRTPKFNIEQTKSGGWKKNAYLNSKLKFSSLIELLLACYFIFGIVMGIKTAVYGMIPFHSLLSLGFLSVFIFSIIEKKGD